MPMPPYGNETAAGGVRFGISLTTGSIRPSSALLDVVRALAVDRVELGITQIERVLGAPVPTVPLEPPPIDGVAFGLLELEEDVLRDSYDLARQTFDAQLRAWRASASLAPLAALRDAWQAAGVTIDIVTAPDLVTWSDEEQDYACRVAAATGARVLATRALLPGPRRLGPVARRHGARISFMPDAATDTGDLNHLLEQDPDVDVAIDLGAWTARGHGSPLRFLEAHANRISHVRLWDCRGGDDPPVPFGTGDAPIADVLVAMRDHAWTFPAMVAIDPIGSADEDDDWLAALAQAIAYCRSRLE